MPRCLAERHGFVSLTNEHGPALRVGVKGDSRYAAPVLGIQFAHRPNQAHRGLTSIDHCDSSGKPISMGRNHGSVYVSGTGAKNEIAVPGYLDGRSH